MITILQHLIFGLQLVPAGLEPLQLCHVGVNTASGIASHDLHLKKGDDGIEDILKYWNNTTRRDISQAQL